MYATLDSVLIKLFLILIKNSYACQNLSYAYDNYLNNHYCNSDIHINIIHKHTFTTKEIIK